MWNPFKIYKYTKAVLARGRQENHYDQGEEGTRALRDLYGEMLFPSIFFTAVALRKTSAGRNALYGLEDKSEEHQLNVYIPKITDGKYLDSLAPNTVGAHYKHLINQWNFEEFYRRRFQSKKSDTFWNKRRENFARHIFLSHDFWHVLFRYDTSPLGEACIQAVTHQYMKQTGPWYYSWMMAYKEYQETGSWKAFGVIREAHKLGKQAKRDLYDANFDELLEMDIEEVREKWNIGAPHKFYEYAEEFPKEFRGDCLHPKYNDPQIKWDVREAIL